MNLVELQERLKEMPLQAVQAYMNGQNPEVPPYLAAAEMQRRTAMQQRAQQAEEPQQSVKEQLEQAAGLMALEQQRQQQAQQQMQQASAQQPMPVGEGIPQPQMQPQPPAMMARGGVASLDVDDRMFAFADGGVIGYQAGGYMSPLERYGQREAEKRAQRQRDVEAFNERMRNDPRQIEMREEAERARREFEAMSPSERASDRGRRLREFIRQVFGGAPSAVAQAPQGAPASVPQPPAPEAGAGRGIMAGPTAEQLAQAPRPAPNVMPGQPSQQERPSPKGGIQDLAPPGAAQAPSMPRGPQSEARGILEGAMRRDVAEPTVEDSISRTQRLAQGLGYEDVQRSRAGLEALMQQQYDPEKLRRERLMASLGRGFSSGSSADRAMALQQQQEAGQRQSMQDILASQTGQAEKQFTAGAQDFDRSRIVQGQQEDRRIGAAGDIFRSEEARELEKFRADKQVALENLKQAARSKNRDDIRQTVSILREAINGAKARLAAAPKSPILGQISPEVRAIQEEIRDTERILMELARQLPEVAAAMKALDVSPSSPTSANISAADKLVGI